MKRLIGLLLIACCCFGQTAQQQVLIAEKIAAASGSFTEVGSGTQRATKSVGGSPSTTLAYPANVVSGNLLIVGGSAWQSGGAPSSITVTGTGTGCASTTFTVLSAAAAVNGGNYRYFIARGVAAGSGACTVTVDPNGASSDFGFSLDEFSAPNATPLDVDGGRTCSQASCTTSSNPTTAVSNSITTVATNDLVIGVMSFSSSDTTITQNGSYTLIGESETSTNSQPFSLVFRTVTTAQAYSVDWTLGAARDWDAYTAAFKP